MMSTSADNYDPCKKAVVIGAGVIGLTSAIRLLENGWSVMIVTEKLSPYVLSDGPAAIWEPFLSAPEEKVFKWAKKSLVDFIEIHKSSSDAGIASVSGYEFGSENSPFVKPRWMIELVDHRDARAYEIPKGWRSGVYFATFIIQMNHFMPYLMKRFIALGGSIQIQKVTAISDIFQNSSCGLVINCAGIGAKELSKDDSVYPIRGQVLKVEAPWIKKFFMATDSKGDYIYVLPRSDSVIIGGTAHKGEWNTSIAKETSKSILERCERLVPGISKSKVISEWVGLRPGRTEIRLEKEYLVTPRGTLPVIHNYGHGGSGITLSWGCASEVVELAQSIKSNTTKSKL